MNEQPQPKHSSHYQIKVAGHLDAAWSAWFEDLVLTRDPDGCTSLTGRVVDQAMLYGVLIKIRDLGLSLVSVQPIKTTSAQQDLRGRDPHSGKGAQDFGLTKSFRPFPGMLPPEFPLMHNLLMLRWAWRCR